MPASNPLPWDVGNEREAAKGGSACTKGAGPAIYGTMVATQSRLLSRPLRIEFPDVLYHIFARGDWRGAIFED